MVFEGTYAVCCPGLAQYSVMDGRRFLMIKDSDEESFTELRVVENSCALARYGTMANARAGKPRPPRTFGQVTTMTAPVAGT